MFRWFRFEFLYAFWPNWHEVHQIQKYHRVTNPNNFISGYQCRFSSRKSYWNLFLLTNINFRNFKTPGHSKLRNFVKQCFFFLTLVIKLIKNFFSFFFAAIKSLLNFMSYLLNFIVSLFVPTTKIDYSSIIDYFRLILKYHSSMRNVLRNKNKKK